LDRAGTDSGSGAGHSGLANPKNRLPLPFVSEHGRGKGQPA
jgi:hypothetical protein